MVASSTAPRRPGVQAAVRLPAAFGRMVSVEGEELQGLWEAGFIRADCGAGGGKGRRGLGDGPGSRRYQR